MSSNHFADEFARLYGKKGCSIENYDWSKPRFFDPSSECYAAETALMSSLTSEAYNKFGFAVEYYINKDKDDIPINTIDNLVKSLDKELYIVRKYAKNSLLKPAKKLAPIINKIIRTLLDNNLDLIQMSGSGSTVYAIDKDINKIKKVYETIKNDYDFVGIYETL